RTLLKFAVPASPRRRPVIEYRLNAARTSWMAGKNTTPMISSSAGPSHSSAAHTEVSPLLPRRRRGVDIFDTAEPAAAEDTDAPGGVADAAAAAGIRPGSATASTRGSAIDQLPFSAVFCRSSSTALGSLLALTPAPSFCWTSILTRSQTGSLVGAMRMVG